MQTTTFPIKPVFFSFWWRILRDVGAVDHSKADEISTQRYPPVVVLVQLVSTYTLPLGWSIYGFDEEALTLSELPTYLVVRPAKFITSAGNFECSQMCHITKLDLFRQEIKIKFMDIECASYTRDATNSCISVTSV